MKNLILKLKTDGDEKTKEVVTLDDISWDYIYHDWSISNIP